MIRFDSDLYITKAKSFRPRGSFRGKNEIRWSPTLIPTVDEVDEFNAKRYEETIRQVLHGQALSFSCCDVNPQVDNHIPIINTSDDKKRERENKRYEMKKFIRQRNHVVDALMATGNYTIEQAREAAITMLRSKI